MTEIHVSPDFSTFRYPLKPDRYSGDHAIKHNEILAYAAGDKLHNGWWSYVLEDEAIDALENDAAFSKMQQRIEASERRSLREYTAHHAYNHDNSFRQYRLQAGQVFSAGLWYLFAFTIAAGMFLSLVLGGGCTPRY